MSCSIVPRSHSLATVRDVSSAAITIMITAIRPGMMKFLLSSSGLYQTRTRASTAGSRDPRPARSSCRRLEKRLAIASR